MSRAYEILRKSPAFQALGDDEARELSERLGRTEFRIGETLMSKGQPPGPAYLIEKGKARILDIREDGSVANVLGFAIRGDLVGERSLLANSPRSASVRACDDLVAWRIEPEDFRAFLSRHAALEKSLRVYIDHVGIRTFLKSIGELASLRPECLRELAERLEPVTVAGGKEIARQGEVADALYFVASGRVLVQVDGKPVALSGPEKYFGEREFLTGEPRPATIVAHEDTVIFRLDRPTFDRIVGMAEPLKRALLDSSRERSEAAISHQYGLDRSQPVLPLPAYRVETETHPSRPWLPRILRRAIPSLAYPMVLQTDEMECGPACLATVLECYRIARPIGWIRDRVEGLGHEGANLDALEKAAQALGFDSRWGAVDLLGLANAHLPAILHWNGCHYVVLLEIERDRYLVADPLLGHSWYAATELLQHWSGIALELRPTRSLVEGRTRPNWIRPLLRFVAPAKVVASLWATAAVLEGVLYVLLAKVAVEFLAAGGGPVPARAIAFVAGCVAASEATRRLRDRTLARVLDRELADYAGRLLARNEGTASPLTHADLRGRAEAPFRIERWSTEVVEPVLLGTGVAVAAAIDIAHHDPILGIAAFVAGALGVAISALAVLANRPAQERRFGEIEHATGFLAEVLARIGRYRMAGTLDWVRTRWMELARGAHGLWVVGSPGLRFRGLAILPLALVWGMAGLATAPPAGVHADLLLLSTLVWLSYRTIATARGARKGFVRLIEVIESPASTSPETAGTKLPAAPGTSETSPPAIGIEAAWYRGENPEREALLLKDISLAVDPGTNLAVVGAPGSGVTEFLEFLRRPEKALRGKIGIAPPGRNSPCGVTTHFASEDPLILSTTVEENLRATVLGTRASRECLSQITHLFELAREIRNLPLAEHTRIGSMGHPISLELAQTIEVARACLGPPQLLLLHRPLSAVDPSIRHATLERVFAKLRGKTTVVWSPAGGPETELADRVLILNEGRLVALGSPQDLLDENTFCRRVLATENLPP